MKTAKIITAMVLAVMTGMLVYTGIVGNLAEEGPIIYSQPWGWAMTVDLYSGFTLFSCWIAFREKHAWQAALWILGLMGLGFWLGALYALVALWKSNGDWSRFWMGNNAISGGKA